MYMPGQYQDRKEYFKQYSLGERNEERLNQERLNKERLKKERLNKERLNNERLQQKQLLIFLLILSN